MNSLVYQQLGPHIVQITINRPQVLNALDFEAVDALAAAVERAHADPELRVLILTGSGERAFCAGGDLHELAGYITEEQARQVSDGMSGVLARLEALPAPVLAAVNGLARGGGSEVALACDLRWMSGTATLGFTQISLAVTPGWGGGQRLLRLAGYSRALEFLLDGRVLTADEALAAGLVNRVLPPEQLLPEAAAWARQVAARPPAVVQAIKQILQAGVRLPTGEAAALEAGAFPPLWAGDDHHRLVEGFLKRTRP